MGIRVRMKLHTVPRPCVSEVHEETPGVPGGIRVGSWGKLGWKGTAPGKHHTAFIKRQQSPHGTSRHPSGMRTRADPTSIDPFPTASAMQSTLTWAPARGVISSSLPSSSSSSLRAMGYRHRRLHAVAEPETSNLCPALVKQCPMFFADNRLPLLCLTVESRS